jgi:hypothetical protein
LSCRYHTWIGHITLLLVLLHSTIYYAVWTSQGVLINKAFAQGREANAVMGGAAFLLSMLMWLACIDAIKRRAYTIFKILHHVGFYGFVVLGCCHYWRMIWWCLPGLILYTLEGSMRLLQAAGVHSNTRILHAAVAADNQLCTLVVSAPDYAVASSGIVWLSSPDVSSFWSTWHLFDYIAVPWPVSSSLQTSGKSLSGKQSSATAGCGASETQTAMLINMKASGNWTKAFITQLAEQGTNVRVKIQGPYADIGSPVIGQSNAGYGQNSTAASDESAGSVIVAGEQIWRPHTQLGMLHSPALTRVGMNTVAACISTGRQFYCFCWPCQHVQP